MINKIKKISTCLAAVRRDVNGFTLTEVMIGMMILTVAIVSASNLLTGIIDSNRNNLTTLQAYYLSQEGLEMVRNIRDTNWLHNRDWLGKAGDVWGGKFDIPAEGTNEYVVRMVNATAAGIPASPDGPGGPNLQQVGSASPWKIEKFTGPAAKIYRHGVGNSNLPALESNLSNGIDTGFTRKIIISKYDCSKMQGVPCPTDKAAYVLVKSKIEWTIGAKQRELLLSEVLSNWKGGAL